MKRKLLLTTMLCLGTILPCPLSAQHTFLANAQATVETIIIRQDAIKVANNQLAIFGMSESYSILNCRETRADKMLLAYVFDLLPDGYVVVAASSMLPPILAYSFESRFGSFDQNNPLFMMLTADLLHRTRYANTLGDTFSKKHEPAWSKLLTKELNLQPDNILEQWPAVGNGWLATNWTQNPPYNNFCPMDPVTLQRSYAGCPAVAMAQILNFHKTTNNTHFNDNDDYYHNYAGRQYWIDNDYALHDFPSFPQLNSYLDILNAHYLNNIPPDNQDKAALTFACGVACKQVYTSQGSGTFGVNQAYGAYVRFGYTLVSLLNGNASDLYKRLKQNIKDTLPAHLAVVDPSWSTGHNVVVDGYNTDEYYHLNFGWGGSYNGWYLLPQGIPYNLTVIEGVVVDIKKITTSITHHEGSITSEISVFPNPSSTNTTIAFANHDNQTCILKIYNTTGQMIQIIDEIKGSEIRLDNKNKPRGIYFFTLHYQNGKMGHGKMILE